MLRGILNGKLENQAYWNATLRIPASVHRHENQLGSSIKRLEKKANDIVEKFMNHGLRPARKDPREALAWLETASGRRFFAIYQRNLAAGRRTVEYFETTTLDREKLRPVSRGPPGPTSIRSESGPRCLPALARHSLPRFAPLFYALARQVQKHIRRLVAVLETLDNGKPIRESRDIEYFLRGAAFLPITRVGLNLLEAGFFPGLNRLRRGGPIIPWEFSSADLA